MLASSENRSHSVDQAISPIAQAGAARAKAAGLSGKDREYWLWLAAEWDKTSARWGIAPKGNARSLHADLSENARLERR